MTDLRRLSAAVAIVVIGIRGGAWIPWQARGTKNAGVAELPSLCLGDGQFQSTEL